MCEGREAEAPMGQQAVGSFSVEIEYKGVTARGRIEHLIEDHKKQAADLQMLLDALPARLSAQADMALYRLLDRIRP